ncbi:hypothetical protein D3C80_1775030 [compost metagenome]
MVDIDHDIQLLSKRPVHHLPDSGEISGLNRVVRSCSDVYIPGYRNADAPVPLVSDFLDQLFGNLGVAPGGFVGSRSIERITKVPARLHGIHVGLHCGRLRLLRSRCRRGNVRCY